MPTTSTSLSHEWAVVASGRTSGATIFEVYDNSALFLIGTEEPSEAPLAHTIKPGERLTIPLDAGESLYAKTAAPSIAARAITTVSGGSIALGFDERSYLGAVLAVTTQPFIEANVKNGSQFSISHEFTGVAQGASVNIVLTTGSTDVLAKGRSITTNGDNVLYEVFRAPTVTGGTAVTVNNYNEVSPLATTVDLVSGATVSAAGVKIDALPIYGSVGAGNRVAGFSNTSGLERRLAQGTKYLVRFTNRSTTAATDIHYALTWYEGPLSTDA